GRGCGPLRRRSDNHSGGLVSISSSSARVTGFSWNSRGVAGRYTPSRLAALDGLNRCEAKEELMPPGYCPALLDRLSTDCRLHHAADRPLQTSSPTARLSRGETLHSAAGGAARGAEAGVGGVRGQAGGVATAARRSEVVHRRRRPQVRVGRPASTAP